MKSPNIKYLPALDHLRFYAVCLIMLFHGALLVFGDFVYTGKWLYSWNPFYAVIMEGHSAVALFMVLSGFLFTLGSSGHKINYLKFLKNRFLRIYPLYLSMIVAGLYFFPDAFSIIPLLKTIFFLGNLTDALNIGPFSAVFWSIAVELQFYMIFPILFLLLNKYGVKSLLFIVLIAFVVRTALVVNGANIRFIIYGTLLGRIDQFIVGMIASRIYLGSNSDIIKRLVWPSVLAVIVMLIFTNRLGGFQDRGWWKLVWPSVEGAAWAFFVTSYTLRLRNNTNVVHSALSKMGEVSYSFYLTHYVIWAAIPTIWFIRIGKNPVINSTINSFLIILPLTLVLSFVTFNLIEKPFLNLRAKYLN